MSSTKKPFLLAIVSLLAGNCTPAEVQTEFSPETSERARTALIAWLECEECIDGELDAVVEIGDVLTPSLAATLKEGPGPASIELMRRQLESNFRELAEYARTHPDERIPMSEEEYLNTYLANYRALYRVRAAQGLGAIGSEDAREALRAALDGDFREDVMVAIRDSLGQLER